MKISFSLNFMRSILLTSALLIICASFSPKQWNGVLLISEKDGEYHAFIDNLDDVNHVSLLTFINEKTAEYPITRKNSVTSFKRSLNDQGYIAVIKDKEVVSSVRLDKIQFMNYQYFQNRVNSVSSSMDTLAHGEPTTYASEEAAKEDVIYDPQSIIVVDKDQKEYEIIEIDGKKIIVERKKEEVEVVETEVVVVEKVEVKSDLSEMEQFLLGNHYIHKVDNHEDIRLKKDLPESIAKEAESVEKDYTIFNNYYSWLHLKEKKSGKDVAFDGEYMVEIDKEYFQMLNSDKLKLKSYHVDHDILLKPHNKKWMGIYYKNTLLTEFKTKTGYRIEEVDHDDFLVIMEHHKYNVNAKDNYITITKDNTVIKKFNTDTFDKEPVLFENK